MDETFLGSVEHRREVKSPSCDKVGDWTRYQSPQGHYYFYGSFKDTRYLTKMDIRLSKTYLLMTYLLMIAFLESTHDKILVELRRVDLSIRDSEIYLGLFSVQGTEEIQHYLVDHISHSLWESERPQCDTSISTIEHTLLYWKHIQSYPNHMELADRGLLGDMIDYFEQTTNEQQTLSEYNNKCESHLLRLKRLKEGDQLHLMKHIYDEVSSTEADEVRAENISFVASIVIKILSQKQELLDPRILSRIADTSTDHKVRFLRSLVKNGSHQI